MSQSLTLPVDAGTARPHRSLLQTVELVGFLFLALNQVVGVLDPPEAFLFDPQAYSQDVGGGGGGRPYPLTTAISHLSEAFILFLLLRNWKPYLGIIRRSPTVFLQMLLIISSTLWSIGPADSLRSSLHYSIDYVLALHFVYSCSVIGFTKLIVRLSAVGAVVSLFLLAVFPGLSHEVASGAYSSAWRGAYENKNYLGATASISILIAGYSLLSGANDRRFALFVMLANMVLLAGSRSSTALVATAACLPLLCVIGVARKPGAGILTVTLGLGGLCLFGAALMSVHDPFALIGKDSTLTGRTAVWHAVIPLIRQRPLLGYGLGFWDIDSDFRNDVWSAANWNAPHAHNDYLDIILQTGIFSFGLVMVNYVLCLYLGVRHMWRVKEGSIVCAMLVLDFMIRGLTETLLPSPATPQIAVLYIAETYLSLLAFQPRSARRLEKETVGHHVRGSQLSERFQQQAK